MLLVSWVYRQVFNCCRRVERVLFRDPDPVAGEYTVPVSKLPWMWIGAMYPDASTAVDCTNTVDKRITYGMTVTKEWLESVTGHTPESWIYLDSESLEEKDFPPDGFVINDTESDEHEESSDGSDSNKAHIE